MKDADRLIGGAEMRREKLDPPKLHLTGAFREIYSNLVLSLAMLYGIIRGLLRLHWLISALSMR